MLKSKILAAVLIAAPLCADAQLEDILNFALDCYNNGIGNTVQQKVTSEIQNQSYNYLMNDFKESNPQAGEVETYLMDQFYKGMIYDSFDWTNFVDGFAKVGSDALINYYENANFEEESAKLADLDFSKPRLQATDQKYNLYNVATAYSNMPKQLTQTTNNIINAYTPSVLQSMGNGSMKKYLDEKINLAKSRNNIGKIGDIYNAKATSLITSKYSGLQTQLLASATKDIRIPLLININPELYLDYYNKARNTPVQENTIDMAYWTDRFNTKPGNWPAKVMFSQYTDLIFAGKTEVSSTNNKLASLSGSAMEAKSLEMLDHRLRPMTTVRYQGITFTTDKLGRITSISGKLEKGKCQEKAAYKAKAIAAEYNIEPSKPFWIIPKKCKGPECIANIYPISKGKDNKANMKSYKKYLKSAIKDNMYISSTINYYGTSEAPKTIDLTVGGNYVRFIK